jgi:beta-N-acetylhexosaminidase
MRAITRMRHPARRLPAGALAMSCLAALAACNGGGSPSAASSATSSPTSSSPTATSPTTSPSKVAACSNASAVRAWPLTRRAAQLVVVPVLDFDIAGVTAEVRAGAGGLLFLGPAAAPTDLGTRIGGLVGRLSPAARPLVMADEEGGGVQRLAGVVPSLPWPRDMAATMTPAQVRTAARDLGRRMAALGVDVDLAPVADVDSRPGPSASNADGSRSFSGDPQVAARYVIAFLEGLRDGGVLPVVKHFPGLGGSVGNTDVRSSATLALSTLERGGLATFRAAIAAGAPAVMVANASVPGLTDRPASLSRAAITGLLRQNLGFGGLVVTDSLSAGAVAAATPSLAQATVEAISAGADMALFGSTLTAAQTAELSPARTLRTFTSIVDGLVAAVRSGALSEQALDRAVVDVLAAKHADLCG